MFGGIFGGFDRGGNSFQASYRCFPVSFIDKLDAENGDKVFLPPSALDRLASLHIDYPMLFRVENKRQGRVTHCGVLEFIAEEGHVYMPYWVRHISKSLSSTHSWAQMMQNMLLTEGEVVHFQNATLPKGTYVKLQPHTSDFLDISNPKAVLERTLRGYSCLTVGDAICLHYNGKKYFIDVVDAKPGNAISVIETDCEVDFAPPHDYVEPPREAPMSDAAPAPLEDVEEAQAPGFAAFQGAAYRVDGRAAAESPRPSSVASSASGSSRPAARPSGKVVFGTGGNRLLSKKAGDPSSVAPPTRASAAEEQPLKKEETGFQAFSGKGYSLK